MDEEPYNGEQHVKEAINHINSASRLISKLLFGYVPDKQDKPSNLELWEALRNLVDAKNYMEQ